MQDFQQFEEEEDPAEELRLLAELKEYAREGQGRDMAQGIGKELPPEDGGEEMGAPAPNLEEGIPGVEAEGEGDVVTPDALSQLTPEQLQQILASLKQG